MKQQEVNIDDTDIKIVELCIPGTTAKLYAGRTSDADSSKLPGIVHESCTNVTCDSWIDLSLVGFLVVDSIGPKRIKIKVLDNLLGDTLQDAMSGDTNETVTFKPRLELTAQDCKLLCYDAIITKTKF